MNLICAALALSAGDRLPYVLRRATPPSDDAGRESGALCVSQTASPSSRSTNWPPPRFSLLHQYIYPPLIHAIDHFHRLGVACPFGVVFADPSNLRARSIRRDRNRR